MVADGCEAIFVLKEDNKIDCYTKKPVRPNTFVKSNDGWSQQQMAPMGRHSVDSRIGDYEHHARRLELPVWKPKPLAKKQTIAVKPYTEHAWPLRDIVITPPTPTQRKQPEYVGGSFGIPRRRQNRSPLSDLVWMKLFGLV